MRRVLGRRPPIEDDLRIAGITAPVEHTDHFLSTKWLGQPLSQNVADAWLLQECLVEADVDFVVECGTNRGGSAYFTATIFDLLGRGQILTIDIQQIAEVTHPRIEFLVGSSTNGNIVRTVHERVATAEARNPLVLLDSEH